MSVLSPDTTYRKIALRLLPLLFILYMVAFLDRVNVGFAKLQMAGDLGLDETDYGIGAGIFFVGYCLLEIPSNLLLHRIGAKRAISRIVLLWGLISMATALVQDKWSFYGLRLLLGMGEAGFFPGIILYLTCWFPTRHRGRTVALFMMALALSGVLGGPLSGWIMESLDGTEGLRGWQWLFLLEGAPAVFLGLLCVWLLDDGPRSAAWLSDEEKDQVRCDLARDLAQRLEVGHREAFSQALADPRVWLMAGIYTLLAMSLYGVSFWLPQIVHDLGQGGVFVTGLLSAIPYGFAAAAMFLMGRSSDRHGERRWHVALSALGGGTGLLICAGFLQAPVWAIVGLTIATAGVYAALAVFWSLPTALLSGRAAAGGIALINSIAALGGYSGPVIVGWVRQSTGSVSAGLYLCALGLWLAALLVLGTLPPRQRF